MKKTKRFIGILTAMFILIAAIVPETAFASTFGTTGSYAITVVTKANWTRPGGESITFGNSPVKVNYRSGWRTKTKTIYPKYRIKGASTDGTHKINKVMSGSSLKLSLKRNKTYKLTIYYDSNGTWLKYCTLRNSKMVGTPSWRVKSTRKVSNYY